VTGDAVVARFTLLLGALGSIEEDLEALPEPTYREIIAPLG
jgi:uncharacterized protein with GYD domain